MSKGWKLITTHQLPSKRVDLPCTCSRNVQHVASEGYLTKQTGCYTKPFAKRVCEEIFQGLSEEQLQREFQGSYVEGDLFGKGPFCVCVCDHFAVRESRLSCGRCRPPMVNHEEEPGPCELSEETKTETLFAACCNWPRSNKIHDPRRGLHPRIITEAEKFTCSVCQERARPQPRNGGCGCRTFHPPPEWRACPICVAC